MVTALLLCCDEAGAVGAQITLRAVACQVGITAPSIYPHFANPQEILNAILARAFEAMVERLRVAVQGDEDPVARLRGSRPRLCRLRRRAAALLPSPLRAP
jgi:AcrR family transcriptional regulator